MWLNHLREVWNPGGIPGDYQATIDWGDRTPPPTVTAAAGGITKGLVSGAVVFMVSGTHMYSEEGPFNISATIQDIGGPTSVIVPNTVSVGDAALHVTRASRPRKEQFSTATVTCWS